MHISTQTIEEFFKTYERAIEILDLNAFGLLYGQTFMFCDPNGSIAVKKEDFLKMIPKRREFFKQKGLQTTTLQSVESQQLDEHYLLVRVMWRMEYKKIDETRITDSTFSSYLLHIQPDTMTIVTQIDHQDLKQRLNELGI